MDMLETMKLLETHGACTAGVDPDWWFAPAGDHASRQRAVAVCVGCPVRNECLEFALANPGPGTWGGLSEAERVRLARQRRKMVPA